MRYERSWAIECIFYFNFHATLHLHVETLTCMHRKTEKPNWLWDSIHPNGPKDSFTKGGTIKDDSMAPHFPFFRQKHLHSFRISIFVCKSAHNGPYTSNLKGKKAPGRILGPFGPKSNISGSFLPKVKTAFFTCSKNSETCERLSVKCNTLQKKKKNKHGLFFPSHISKIWTIVFFLACRCAQGEW